MCSWKYFYVTNFVRLPLIVLFFFFSVSGLYCGLTSLSTIFVMPGQNHRFLSNEPVVKEMCPEHRLVPEVTLLGIAVVHVLERTNAT